MNVPEVSLSLLGISHRSQWVSNVVDEIKENLLNLLSTPKNYHVLFYKG